jgi:RNA polymerase sigma factor (sigma-70 family)
VLEGTDVDRELLARVRGGDDTAFGELFSRHADAVRRFSSRHVRDAAEAEDLTAEAFYRVLQAIRRGSGPNDHVRTYLLTVARRVAWEWSGRRRDVPVDDEELSRRVEPYADATAQRAEYTLIGRAFTSLPERWRTVLWQVEVEGERPAAVAPHYGLSPNAMSALARRAREGLRAAYLQAHLAEDTGARSCGSVLSKLGSYTAGGVQGAEQRRIRKHLQTCASCNALHAELSEVCSTLRAHAAFMVVPAAAAALVGGKLATSVAVVGKGALLTARVKLVLAGVASAAAVGLFSLLAGVSGPSVIRSDHNARQDEVLSLSTSASTSASTTSSPIGQVGPTMSGEPVPDVVLTTAPRQQVVAPTGTSTAQTSTTGSAEPPAAPTVATTTSGVDIYTDPSTTPTTTRPPANGLAPTSGASTPVSTPVTTTVIMYPTPVKPK